MLRMGVIAVAAATFSSLASAQRPPAPSGGTAPPPPNILREQDRAAGDPITRIRADEELDKKRYERVASSREEIGKARPAKPVEVQSGKQVNDSTGVFLGVIEKVEPDGVIVTVGTSHIKVPGEAFGINKKGLLLDVTKQQFDQLIASANAKPKS